MILQLWFKLHLIMSMWKINSKNPNCGFTHFKTSEYWPNSHLVSKPLKG